MYKNSHSVKIATIFVVCFVIAFSFLINIESINAQIIATPTPTTTGTGDFSIQPYGPTSFTALLSAIITWIFNIAIPIAMIMIIWSGIILLTSGGNPAKVKQGQDMLKYAILGLVVIFIGKGFISLIQSILELGQ